MNSFEKSKKSSVLFFKKQSLRSLRSSLRSKQNNQRQSFLSFKTAATLLIRNNFNFPFTKNLLLERSCWHPALSFYPFGRKTKEEGRRRRDLRPDPQRVRRGGPTHRLRKHHLGIKSWILFFRLTCSSSSSKLKQIAFMA